ncbi:flagellar basal-body rod protein FlgB [Thioclava sp. ES.031]|uniref:FlgB family protein n=1 Tax=Thioclava sp. ES.031 TaxID=1798203 RepID=UPI000BF6A8B3|nr:FlgB family protein [Thioclava sp. ES.031]PFG61599.1 flagellar basal-body rod protein FlgB [Thioclava sp. ES.031]
MFEKIEIMKMASAMATHAAARQNAVAENIANADTPGYAARDLPAFEDLYRSEGRGALRATRSGHIDASATISTAPEVIASPGVTSPDGNSVSLEEEMVRSVAVKREHDLSLAIYRSSLNILRSSLGRG